MITKLKTYLAEFALSEASQKKKQKTANNSPPSKPAGWSTSLSIHSNFCLYTQECFLTLAHRIGPLKFKLQHT